jgi:hypothetical protein
MRGGKSYVFFECMGCSWGEFSSGASEASGAKGSDRCLINMPQRQSSAMRLYFVRFKFCICFIMSVGYSLCIHVSYESL